MLKLGQQLLRTTTATMSIRHLNAGTTGAQLIGIMRSQSCNFSLFTSNPSLHHHQPNQHQQHNITVHRISTTARLPTNNGDDDTSASWVHSITEGVQRAEKENKPIMLFVHRPWCSACKKLVPIVKQNSEVKAMNSKFVVVEMTGEDEKTEANYAPDGAYVPRIVFLSSKGEVMKITNPNNFTGTNMYTYQSAEDLVSAMKKAIE